MIGMGGRLNDEYAFVTSVCRDDLVSAGLPKELKDKISDDLLIEIADRLEDALLNCEYWDCLSTIMECMNLKKNLSEGNENDEEEED